MGLFKKIFKGVKKVFKKVGKTIKKTIGKVGKFMDRIGIVGQIGLSLLLPGIGAAMSGMWGSVVGGMQAYSGLGSSIINAAGGFLNTATNLAVTAGNAFSSLSQGIIGTVGETLKLGAQKLGLGDLATRMGFETLGTSINSASLESIKTQFGNITDVFAGNIQGIDPTGAYAQARDRAMMTPEQREFVSGIQNFEMTPELEQQRLADMENVQDMYETGGYTRGVTVGADTPDLYGPAQQGVTVGVDTPDLYGPEAELPALGDAGVNVAAQPQKSLLGRATDRAVSIGTEAAEEAFGTTVKRGLTTAALEAVGVDTTPDIYQTSYGTYVPDLDFTLVQGAPEFRFFDFQQNNQSFINSNPYGATAAMVENYYPELLRKFGGQ